MMTTAVRKGVAAGTGLASSGLGDFPTTAQIHALTVCMAVMLLEAHGRHGALEFVAHRPTTTSDTVTRAPDPAVTLGTRLMR
ncbi:hypothetical protein ACIRL0_12035 [Streptomyces sp. NPDC102365]|uniref:hypothetical protein n=1 Tax=Streptomyces sp. NPDC102365 TaxID=3366162 RepID=UPI0037FEDD20